MTAKSPRLILGAVLAALISAALAAGPAQAKKGGGKVDITNAANLPITDEDPVTEIDGVTTSEIKVGNKFKGKKIRDVNVTVQITGTGTDSIEDLKVRLSAPNGATTTLFDSLDPGNLLGPLTLDDETLIDLQSDAPFPDPTLLFSPWQGTSQAGSVGLWPLDNGSVKGTWTLIIRDDTDGDTNVLNSWRLNVRAGAPYQTK